MKKPIKIFSIISIVAFFQSLNCLSASINVGFPDEGRILTTNTIIVDTGYSNGVTMAEWLSTNIAGCATTNALAAETSARISADTSNRNELFATNNAMKIYVDVADDTETSSRISGDAALSNYVEQSVFSSDSAMSNYIDNLMTAEISDRTAGDLAGSNYVDGTKAELQSELYATNDIVNSSKLDKSADTARRRGPTATCSRSRSSTGRGGGRPTSPATWARASARRTPIPRWPRA